MSYPRELSGTEVPPGLSALVVELAHRLLAGDAYEHQVLRAQLAAAHIDRVTLTGAGAYAYFKVSSECALVSPPEMIGGEVTIEAPALDAPAGCLIKVSEGKIDYVEIYTFGEKAWPDDPRGVSLGFSDPLPISH